MEHHSYVADVAYVKVIPYNLHVCASFVYSEDESIALGETSLGKLWILRVCFYFSQDKALGCPKYLRSVTFLTKNSI